MPVYEYTCPKCGKIEVIHHMSEKISKCPTCNSDIKKVISVSNFHLVGNCWAKDGYTSKHSK